MQIVTALTTQISSPAWRLLFSAGLVVSLTMYARPDNAIVQASTGTSLRFFGTGQSGGQSNSDRVKIPLGTFNGRQLTTSSPVNVGGDFTIEFWMQASAATNDAEACESGVVGWYYGNILVDRDVFGNNVGDYGIAIRGGSIIFGVNNGTSETNLCGDTPVLDGQWHHIAVTRSATSGLMRLFVDGQLDAQASGPTGSIAYPTGRTAPAEYPNDPYLVLGAEKHDYPGSLYYSGLFDEARISNIVRYSANFTRPNSPFTPDANTMALYHFDEGSGASIGDSSSANGGPSNGTLLAAPGGPTQHWSAQTPFGASPSPSPGPKPSSTSVPAPHRGCDMSRADAGAATSSPVALRAPTLSPMVAASIFITYLPIICRP